MDLKLLARRVFPAIPRRERRQRVLECHAHQNAQADARYATLVADDPSRALDPAQKAEIDDYAHETFGSVLYAPWLRTYAAYRRAFLPGWIPNTYVALYWGDHLLGDYRERLNRIRMRRTLDCDLFPDILYAEGGRLIFPDGSEVPPDRLAEVIFERGDTAYLKLNRTSQGRGITLLRRDGFHPDMLPMEHEFAIQHSLRHAPAFDRFTDTAAVTLRITTVMTADGPRARESRIALPCRGKDRVTHDTAVILMVDVKTGAFGAEGLLGTWHVLTRHPDTDELFADMVMPHMADMVARCEALHARVPGAGVLGWDLCPQEGGAFGLFEVNAVHPGIKQPEAAIGPLFADLGWDRFHVTHPLDTGGQT